MITNYTMSAAKRFMLADQEQQEGRKVNKLWGFLALDLARILTFWWQV